MDVFEIRQNFGHDLIRVFRKGENNIYFQGQQVYEQSFIKVTRCFSIHFFLAIILEYLFKQFWRISCLIFA